MKFFIRRRTDGEVLFESEAEVFRLTVETAVKFGTNLSGAKLCRADLCGANLSGAKLYRADLCGANLRGVNLYEAKGTAISQTILTSEV